MALTQLPPSLRARGVKAVLGPTNTGKTHLAIDRMLAHPTGIIGLPLRLLAREVYGRIVARVGKDAVALVTGEEKIKPKFAKYWVATVEAMPRDIDVAFVAIDEIQIAADFERGHIFTDRLLNMRGTAETLLIGAETIRPLIESLLPGVDITTRPRLSQLVFAGEKKISRLPRRSAIVAFSVDEVYAIAELIRRQSGGAAVVLGALSPRTRNAQVELYQSGEVDYLVATDAIGMGLNLDVDHVAFAADRKFDGVKHRRLMPAEFGQIAGRAGRHIRDGTFGTTGRCPGFEQELVEQMESHTFEPLRMLQWRNTRLDFSTLASLLHSLDQIPDEPGLTRVPLSDDLLSLESLSRDPEVKALLTNRAAVERVWEVCQVPDYRKLSPQAHNDLVTALFVFLMRRGYVPQDWFRERLSEVDRTDGDMDTLSARIAQVRTWSFVANRNDWLQDPRHWQGVTRDVEDRLSDALHERLTHRFLDRRTSLLMRRLRENAMLEAEITAAGDVLVEAHNVGRLLGFQFVADSDASGPDRKALQAAALKALAREFETRATRVSNAVDEAFLLSNDGSLRFNGEVIARLVAGEKVLEPRLRILADDHLAAPSRDLVQTRIDLWLKAHIEKLLGPLLKLEAAENLTGISRGIAFQVAESLGVLDRTKIAEDLKSLDQDARAALRAMGVRFGAFNITVPALIRPAPRALAAHLWALSQGSIEIKGLDDILHLAASGRTSIPVNVEILPELYRAAGFRVCGTRAVRVDILERLADLIRPAISYRPGITQGEVPAGAADGDGFIVTTAMTSLCGCAGEDFATILRALGYAMVSRPGPAMTIAPKPVEAAPEPASSAAVDLQDAIMADALANLDEPAPEQTPSEESAPSASAAEPVTELTVEQTASELASPAEAVADAPAAEAAPEMVEIWRPQRQQRHAPRPDRKKQFQRPATQTAPAPVDGEAPRPREERRSFGADKEGGEGRPRHGQRPPRRDGEVPSGEKRSFPKRDGANRPDNGGRPGKSFSGKPYQGKGGQSSFQSAPPREVERKPDPDSPFAKLLALKAELEARNTKG